MQVETQWNYNHKVGWHHRISSLSEHDILVGMHLRYILWRLINLIRSLTILVMRNVDQFVHRYFQSVILQELQMFSSCNSCVYSLYTMIPITFKGYTGCKSPRTDLRTYMRNLVLCRWYSLTIQLPGVSTVSQLHQQRRGSFYRVQSRVVVGTPDRGRTLTMRPRGACPSW